MITIAWFSAAYIRVVSLQLEPTKLFPRPIVTQVVPLKAFYTAEAYHQGYAKFHPDDPYIARNDGPKVEHLREQFPDLYKK